MGLGDRIRGFFNRKNNPALAELEAFATSRKGVEGFIEPRTATNATTLLLVDRDGAHQRAAVREPQDAASFCERLGIPVYDAAVVGYPKRMVDYERGRRSAHSSIDDQFAELEKRFTEGED